MSNTQILHSSNIIKSASAMLFLGIAALFSAPAFAQSSDSDGSFMSHEIAACEEVAGSIGTGGFAQREAERRCNNAGLLR